MLNICLSMSKYPLGSNLGGTGDWGGVNSKIAHDQLLLHVNTYLCLRSLRFNHPFY